MHASKKTPAVAAPTIIRSALSPQKRVGITFPAIGRTKQDGKDACDINKIMHRYIRVGVLDHVSKYEPQYGEHTGLDFQEAINLVDEANTMFAALPSQTRAAFENNPAQFMDWVSNPENLAQIQQGTAAPEPTPATQNTEDSSPPSSTPNPPAEPSET